MSFLIPTRHTFGGDKLQRIQDTILTWFQQFTPQVFIEGYVPFNTPFPYITVSYATSEIFENTMLTFQIWTRSTTFNEVNAIAQLIQEVVPSMSQLTLDITGDNGYEYFNPDTSQWVFVQTRAEVQTQAIKFAMRSPPHILQWRKVKGDTVGRLWLMRGTPFIQPRSIDDQTLRVYYGNIVLRSHLFI